MMKSKIEKWKAELEAKKEELHFLFYSEEWILSDNAPGERSDDVANKLDALRKEIAVLNRKIFLEPYRLEFESLTEEKKRAAIIIELIKIEPSHLAEPWILREVIAWTRKNKFNDHLRGAFFEQNGRVRPTVNQNERIKEDFYLKAKVQAIIRKYKCTVNEAAGYFAHIWDCETSGLQPEPFGTFDRKLYDKTIHDRFYKSKNAFLQLIEKMDESPLPRPYYGLDVDIDLPPKLF